MIWFNVIWYHVFLIQYNIIQYNDIHIRYIIYMGSHLHVPRPLPPMVLQALVIQAGERLAQVMSELLTHRCEIIEILPGIVGISGRGIIQSELGGGNSNIFYVYPYLGKSSNLTNIFQMGWNHQLVKVYPDMLLFVFVGTFLNIPEFFSPDWIANMIITRGERCVYIAWSDMQRSITEGCVCWLFCVSWGRYWLCWVNGVLVEIFTNGLFVHGRAVPECRIVTCRAVESWCALECSTVFDTVQLSSLFAMDSL